MHALGAHLPLEKCKKPRTGRGFLRMDEGQSEKPSYITSITRFFDSLSASVIVRGVFVYQA